jgi:hypothetical protein
LGSPAAPGPLWPTTQALSFSQTCTGEVSTLSSCICPDTGRCLVIFRSAAMIGVGCGWGLPREGQALLLFVASGFWSDSSLSRFCSLKRSISPISLSKTTEFSNSNFLEFLDEFSERRKLAPQQGRLQPFPGCLLRPPATRSRILRKLQPLSSRQH